MYCERYNKIMAEEIRFHTQIFVNILFDSFSKYLFTTVGLIKIPSLVLGYSSRVKLKFSQVLTVKDRSR